MTNVVQVGGYRAHTKGKLPIDEVCQCGKLKSQHSPALHRQGDTLVVEEGHGDGVACQQFTFKDFVFDPNDHRPTAKGWRPT